jgi:hypothetical protein
VDGTIALDNCVLPSRSQDYLNKRTLFLIQAGIEEDLVRPRRLRRLVSRPNYAECEKIFGDSDDSDYLSHASSTNPESEQLNRAATIVDKESGASNV